MHFDQYELLLLAVKVWQQVNNGSPAPSGGKIQFRTSFHVARIRVAFSWNRLCEDEGVMTEIVSAHNNMMLNRSLSWMKCLDSRWMEMSKWNCVGRDTVLWWQINQTALQSHQQRFWFECDEYTHKYALYIHVKCDLAVCSSIRVQNSTGVLFPGAAEPCALR